MTFEFYCSTSWQELSTGHNFIAMAWILTILWSYGNTMWTLAHTRSWGLIPYDSITSHTIESKGLKWMRHFKSHDSTLLPLSSMCSSQSNTHRWLLTTQSHLCCIYTAGECRDIAHLIFLLITDSTPAFVGFLSYFKTEVLQVCETF